MAQQPITQEVSARPVKRPPIGGKLFYGWWIVICGLVASFLNQGIFTIGPSAYIAPIRQEMGWTAAAISLGFSIRQFEQGLLGPIFGYLLDRVGPRPMASIGIVVMSAGLMMFANVHALWQFYLACVVMAIGQSMGSTQAYAATAVHWFRRKRGRASSILGAGTAMGYVGVYPITLLMAMAGWRGAAVICALLYLFITFPLAQLIRRRPQEFGLLPDGDPPGTEPAAVVERGHRGAAKDGSFSVSQAMRSKPFWMVLIARAFYGLTTNVHHVHEFPHLVNRGFTTRGAGLFISIYGIEQVAARLLAGPLSDHFGRFRLFRSAFILLGIGWAVFANISPDVPWTMAAFFLTYGLGHAFHTVAGQAILADYFGPARYATLSGIMSPLALVISVSGPLAAGMMFDRLGNYHAMFLIMAPIVALPTLAMFWAGKPTLSGQELEGKKKG